MDTVEKIKSTWKRMFASEIPLEFVTRLECELSKVENNQREIDSHLLTWAKFETKSKIDALNSELRKEEFFYEVVNSVCDDNSKSMSHSTEDNKLNVEVSALYAKVNKPSKPSSESEPHYEDLSPTQNLPVMQTASSNDDYDHVDMGDINKAKPSLKSKNKLRGSVKAKIKMFERSDSSSGEETAAGVEGDYAKLVLKAPTLPPVSPKPSPASRRRPRANEYEEISLPFAGKPSLTQNADNPSNTSIQSTANLQTSNTDNSCSSDTRPPNCSSSKQEGSNNKAVDIHHTNTEQPVKLNIAVTAHGKKPAPPVPLRRSRGGNESVKSEDGDALKKTEQATLKYSDHGPQLATKRKPACDNELVKPLDKIHSDNAGTGVPSAAGQKSEGAVESDYCAIEDTANTSSFKNRHVTLVQVKSNEGTKEGQANDAKFPVNIQNVTMLGIQNSDRQLSRSHGCLATMSNTNTDKNLGATSGNVQCRSMENVTQDEDYVDLDYSMFKPANDADSKSAGDKMDSETKSGEKDGDSTTGDKRLYSEGSDVVGTRSKSVSSSESEEDLGATVLVRFTNDDKNPEQAEQDQSDDEEDEDKLDTTDSQTSSDRKSTKKKRKRVPDYEKWTFQHLLTQTGVSVADNENLTDTGSEDDMMYDNVPEKHEFREHIAGQSDDSGVCENSLSPEEALRSYGDAEIEEALNVEENRPGKSTSTAGSRVSTTSCVTVDGDSVFLQRCDSNDGTSQLTIPEDDEESYSSLDDQIDSKGVAGVSYQSEQLRMRHLVVKGILESERSYLHVIDQLVKAKHFLQSAAMKSSPGVIALEDVTTIFYKMDDFHHIHKEFVDELQSKVKNWSDDQQIAEAVKKLVVYFKAYEEYVANYPIAVETIRKYQRNEETKHLLEEQMDPFKDEALKLEDVLLKPVQRIQTNHLVLHDLIRHTPEEHPDYRSLLKALKLSEENLRMYNAHPGTISDNTSPDGRQLVKSGFVVEVSRDKKCSRHLRYIFLFSDVLICTKHKGSAKHKDVYFKYIWSLPVASLSMHKKGDHKYQLKESLEDLKNKIGNLKVELREEMLRADTTNNKAFSLVQKRASRNVEKLKKKIHEQEATLVEGLPRLPLHLEVETFRSHTFLFTTDYEREEWREALDSQCNKCHGLAPAQPSTHECEVMINNTKLHTQVNGIGTVLLKKDEEMLTGNLSVTIHKMQGLEAPCDVYCCMEMDSYGHFYKKAQTGVSRLDNDASWNQDFDLELDGSQTLRILCYKKLPGDETDVVIGKCALELSLSWLNSKFNEKTISMNDISITISIRHTPASKTLKRTQSKCRTGIFGVKIENVCRRENKTVPSIITACVQQVESRGIGEVGIYRVSGVTSDIQHFKRLFDKNPIAASHHAEEADIHAITGVLKLYFRELPEPLFTDELYQSFIQSSQLKMEEAKEKCMLELLHSLPDANYYTVLCIIEHLVRVSKQCGENKMSLSNLATIFGPTLMHPAVKDTNIDPMVQMAKAAKDAGMQTEVIYFFLKLGSIKSIRRSATL